VSIGGVILDALRNIAGWFTPETDLDRCEDSFRLELKKRPNLSDGDFVKTFYPGATYGLEQMVLLIRDYLQTQFHVQSLYPGDCLSSRFPDIPFSEIVYDLGKLTKRKIKSSDIQEIDETLHGLVIFFYQENKTGKTKGTQNKGDAAQNKGDAAQNKGDAAH